MLTQLWLSLGGPVLPEVLSHTGAHCSRDPARPQPVVPVSRAGSSWHWLHSLAASPSEQGSSASDTKEALVAERDDSEGGRLLPGDSQRSCSFASRLSITFSFSWSSRLSLRGRGIAGAVLAPA